MFPFFLETRDGTGRSVLEICFVSPCLSALNVYLRSLLPVFLPSKLSAEAQLCVLAGPARCPLSLPSRVWEMSCMEHFSVPLRSPQHPQTQAQHQQLKHPGCSLLMGWDTELDALSDDPRPRQSKNLTDESHRKKKQKTERAQRAALAGIWGGAAGAGLIKQSQVGRAVAPLSQPPCRS